MPHSTSRENNIDIRAEGDPVAHPLFQAGGGGSTPTSALFHITPISHGMAKSWVERWHYSKRMPTGKNLCYGLWSGPMLYAVIIYGIGVNPFQAKFLGVSRVLEIKRMCRVEPRQEYPLSRFIALTMKMAVRRHPCDCVVAFADPDQDHKGTVYKASGFTLHGKTNAEWHLIDADGNTRHRRYAFRHARRNGSTLAESRDALGCTRVKTAPKLRWVRFIREAA